MFNVIFKKVIVVALCIFLILPSCIFAYTPGPREYSYEFKNLIYSENAEIQNGNLVLSDNGIASMDLLLPFTSEKITIEYSTRNDANLVVNTGRNEYSVQLSKKESTVSLDILNEEVSDLVMTISTDKALVIRSMVFGKEDADISPSNTRAEFKFSSIEENLLTTVAIKEGSVVLFDHGALRYLDFDNTRTIPRYYNDSIYIPAFALARALDMYIEDYSDMNYLFMRSQDEKIEIFYENGETYYTTAGKKIQIDYPVVYDENLTWIPVRQTAEFLEKTVEYKDGIILIDYKLNVDRIVNSTSTFADLNSKLSKYEISDNSNGKTYHISKSKNASDNNDGTEAYPFETIQKAADVMEPGDTAIIHEGVYSETVVPKNSGLPSKPIRYTAADGENVILSNIAELSGFLKFKDNIWCAKVPKDVGKYRLQVFYNGEALTQGRHPNVSNNDNAVEYFSSINKNVFGAHGDITIKTDQGGPNLTGGFAGKLFATSDKGLLNQKEKDYWKGATWIGLKGAGWSL